MTEHSEKNEPSNSTKPVLTAVFLMPYFTYNLTMSYELSKWQNATKESRINLNVNTISDTLKGFYYPILKPLGDLTKDEKTCNEINEYLEPNGLEINNFLLLKNSLNAVAISWEEMQNVLNILYREHYDVYGLINKGLAVSVHDVA